MLLEDAIRGYLLFKATRASPRTIETDRYMLEGFLRWYGNREIGEVTPEDVRAFMAHEEERGLAPSTIARARATLSSLYTWLCDPEVGLADQNPVR
ncbi:MAG: site-specific integrase, partial [Anaerolineae bacterium]